MTKQLASGRPQAAAHHLGGLPRSGGGACSAVERLWQTVIAAKRRARRQMEATLTVQRRELAALRQEETTAIGEAEAARRILWACEDEAEAMMTSTEPVPARRFLEVGARRQSLEEKVDGADREAEAAAEAVAGQMRRIADTAHRLSRIDAQIGMCEARIDQLRDARELAEANEADDEAAEAIAALRMRQVRLAA